MAYAEKGPSMPRKQRLYPEPGDLPEYVHCIVSDKGKHGITDEMTEGISVILFVYIKSDDYHRYVPGKKQCNGAYFFMGRNILSAV